MVIAVIGPTAVGKSHLAHQLAPQIGAEIISMDSVQVYRKMDIGSAKPDARMQQQIAYHLLDIVDFWQPFNVYQYLHRCHQAIKQIQQRQKSVIICGGSMLYFRSLIQGLAELPKTDPILRQQLQQDYQQDSHKLYQQLKQLDSDSAKRLHPNDQQRIVRALAINLSSAKTSQQAPPPPLLNIDCLITLQANQRQRLHQTIAQRWRAMLQQGLLEEVMAIWQHPQAKADLTALQSVGYKQLIQHLQGQLSLQQASEKAQTATRQLAKKQSTWLRSLHKIRAADISLEYDQAINIPRLVHKLQVISDKL